MKTAANLNGNDLITWLQSATEIRMADLYTITLNDGTVSRYTSWDANLTVQGNTFLAGPPHLKRSQIEEKLGLDVSSLEVEIAAGLSDTINGVPVLQMIANGSFDGATLRIDRLFMDSTGEQIGTVVRFSGIIGEVEEVGRSSAKVTVNALVQLLTTQQLPNIILQPNCTNTLFDARCGLIKSNLLQFSDQFDNSVWIKSGSTTVTGNNAADPFGGNLADTISFAAKSTNTTDGVSQVCSPYSVDSQTFTFSVWLSVPSGTAQVELIIEDNPFSGHGGGTGSDVTVTPSWQRFTITGTMSVTANSQVRVWIRAPFGQALSAYSVQAFGAQLDPGPAATNYQSTTTGVASFFEFNTVQAGSTVNKIISVSSKADGSYDNGQIRFTSGPNAGITKAIKSYFAQQLFFNSPLPLPPNAGDTFIAYPGCDKTQATCTTKFNNLTNFEGFPYVPVPETAI